MLPDIKKLILLYATEPIYWFADWVDKIYKRKKEFDENEFRFHDKGDEDNKEAEDIESDDEEYEEYEDEEDDEDNQGNNKNNLIEEIKQPNINQKPQSNKNGGFISGKTYTDDDGKVYKFTVPHKYNWTCKEWYIKLLENMEQNPRASRYLIDLLDNKNERLMDKAKTKLARNPHPLIYRYLSTSSELRNHDLIDEWSLSMNKTTDEEYKQYILEHFCLDIDSQIFVLDFRDNWSVLCTIYGNENMIETFKEHILYELEIFDTFDDKYKQHIRKELSSNSNKVAIEILRDNPKLIDYRSLCKNSGALELLNSNSEEITDNIQANPHPTIIAILSNLIDKTNFTPDLSNMNIYMKMRNMRIEPSRIISNSGAVHIVEKNLDFLKWMFDNFFYDDYWYAKLPDNITPTIVDELVRLSKEEYDEMPDAVLHCASPHITRFYRDGDLPELDTDTLHIIAQHNNDLLTKDLYGPRLVNKLVDIFEI